jgi:hypothetical protein
METETKINIYTIDGITVRVKSTFGNVPIKQILFNIVTAQLKEQEKIAV